MSETLLQLAIIILVTVFGFGGAGVMIWIMVGAARETWLEWRYSGDLEELALCIIMATLSIVLVLFILATLAKLVEIFA